MNYWSMRRKKPLHYNDRIVLRAALAALKGRDLRGRAVALRTLLRLARDYPRLNIEAANQGRGPVGLRDKTNSTPAWSLALRA
jgi:hypothetical protein